MACKLVQATGWYFFQSLCVYAMTAHSKWSMRWECTFSFQSAIDCRGFQNPSTVNNVLPIVQVEIGHIRFIKHVLRSFISRSAWQPMKRLCTNQNYTSVFLFSKFLFRTPPSRTNEKNSGWPQVYSAFSETSWMLWYWLDPFSFLVSDRLWNFYIRILFIRWDEFTSFIIAGTCNLWCTGRMGWVWL